MSNCPGSTAERTFWPIAFSLTLAVKDLRDAWNEKYKEYLKIDVPNDNQGILQDIHWSHGSFGYFPTYSLGSFYAAQFFNQAKVENPNLLNDIKDGNNKNLLKWLREKIHENGKKTDGHVSCALGKQINNDE